MPDDIAPPPWRINDTGYYHYPVVLGANNATVAWIFVAHRPSWEYIIARVNLLAGVDPEAFPAICDWLKSQGLAQTEDSPDA
jgi:hypothetical protein